MIISILLLLVGAIVIFALNRKLNKQTPQPMNPLDTLQQSTRILCILTHADDEILLTPLLAKKRADQTCRIIVATEGVPGVCHHNLCETKSLAEVRASELATSAAFLGFEAVQGYMPSLQDIPTAAERRAAWDTATPNGVVALVREQITLFAPDVIVTFDPRHGTTGHVEHMLTGEFVIEATRGFFDPSKVVLMESKFVMEPTFIGIAPWSNDPYIHTDYMGEEAWQKTLQVVQLYQSQWQDDWIELVKNAPVEYQKVSLALLSESNL